MLHNPFHHIKNARRIKFSNQFLNYKPIDKDDFAITIDLTKINDKGEEDCFTTPYKNVVHKAYETSFGALAQQMRNNTLIIPKMGLIHKQTSSEIEDEMSLEIKIHTILSEDVEKQLKLIPHIKPVSLLEIENKKVVLSPSIKKHTLILDLDDTLVCTLQYSTTHQLYKKSIIHRVKYFSKSTTQLNNVQFVKRPYLEIFLADASRKYEIIVIV